MTQSQMTRLEAHPGIVATISYCVAVCRESWGPFPICHCCIHGNRDLCHHHRYAYKLFSRNFFLGILPRRTAIKPVAGMIWYPLRANSFRSCSRAIWSFVSYDVPEMAPLW